MFLERGGRREKERERSIGTRKKHQWVGSHMHPNQACAMTGNPTIDFLLCGMIQDQLTYIIRTMPFTSSSCRITTVELPVLY